MHSNLKKIDPVIIYTIVDVVHVNKIYFMYSFLVSNLHDTFQTSTVHDGKSLNIEFFFSNEDV